MSVDAVAMINRLFVACCWAKRTAHAVAALLCMVAESWAVAHAWAYARFPWLRWPPQTVVAIDIVDQRPRAERYRATPDLRWVDLGRRRATVLGVASAEWAPKHATIWPVVVVLTLAVAVSSARKSTRIWVTADTIRKHLASLPPGHPTPSIAMNVRRRLTIFSVRRGHLRHVWTVAGPRH